jgi:predicted DNA-binding WGR domain protein
MDQLSFLQQSASVMLHRHDPARNLHRYYQLDIQTDLFGNWCFVRRWGRIGRFGQMRSEPFSTPEAAQAALERQRRTKERRGYMPR